MHVRHCIQYQRQPDSTHSCLMRMEFSPKLCNYLSHLPKIQRDCIIPRRAAFVSLCLIRASTQISSGGAHCKSLRKPRQVIGRSAQARNSSVCALQFGFQTTHVLGVFSSPALALKSLEVRSVRQQDEIEMTARVQELKRQASGVYHHHSMSACSHIHCLS